MKKFTLTLSALAIFAFANAKIVFTGTAKTVASNYYTLMTQKQVNNITLVSTAKSSNGDPLYYVYNVNGTEGFIIISAEDAGRPIIGYSTEGNWVAPSATFNAELNYWMNSRKSEIEGIRAQNMQADLAVSQEWSSYLNNKIYGPVAMSTAHAPLVQSKWNQNGGGAVAYNAYCPGGSVTGCVATTMAQIMRYWSYPTTGTSSHSYTAGSYGTQTANFAATTYNWANMPLTGSNADVARISYHCGVSVNMNYSPSASGAQVCGANPSADYSYSAYFKYDPGCHCIYYSGNTASWNTQLIAEFAASRPVQYVGVDPTYGGHTWVSDGNDATDNIHQNWGWGGAGDGYFPVTALTTNGMNFSNQMSALIGIKPMTPAVALDAGTYGITSPKGTTCNSTLTPAVTIRNFGSSNLTSCTINYKLDNGTPQTYSWTGNLVSYQSEVVTLPAISASVGSHTFTAYTSSPNGSTDANAANDQLQSGINVITNTASVQSPYIQGFETGTFPYTDFYINNPAGYGWTTSTSAASSGTTSIRLENFSSTVSDVDDFITPSIDMTAVSSQTLTFKLAHAQRNAQDLDGLVIFSSTNCGTSWVQRYSKSGTTLANAGTSATAFTPTASQWRQETVNLSSLSGMADVRLKFQFTSGGAGNNIYIDDINIATTGSGINEEFGNSFGLEVFPNPVNANTTVSFNIQDKYKVSVGMFDIVGKEVVSLSKSSDLSAGSYTFPLDQVKLNSGIYFIKLDVNGHTVTRKVIVE